MGGGFNHGRRFAAVYEVLAVIGDFRVVVYLLHRLVEVFLNGLSVPIGVGVVGGVQDFFF